MGSVVKSITSNPLKAITSTVGASMDPFNLTGYGGIPGVNSTKSTSGAGIIGDITGENATNAAIAAQTKGTSSANQALANTYSQQQGYLNPYSDAGKNALSQLAGGNIGANYQQSPGYQAQMTAGQNAINNQMAARGMGNSGAALKALTSYSQDLANQDYQQYYQNESNRLSQLAGYGQNASNNLASAAGAYGSNLSNNYMGLGNATASANIAQGNQFSNLIGQGAGIAAMFSDERLKTNVSVIDSKDIKEFRKNLTPYLFEYISNEHGEGQWAGVMAQDLEKSKLGKLLVVEDKDGNKQIDIKKAVSLLLALQAEVA